MRISSQQQQQIKRLIEEVTGKDAKVILFGSRLDDNRRGGDLDLLVELTDKIDNPAWLAARLTAKISRLMAGRSVDVILSAPNLKNLSIHQHAKLSGVAL